MGMLYEYDSIEQDIINRAGKRMAEEIDFSILADLFCDIGWTRVKLEPMTHEQSAEIDQWVTMNIQGDFKNMGLIWVFENPKDASWFLLKWVS